MNLAQQYHREFYPMDMNGCVLYMPVWRYGGQSQKLWDQSGQGNHGTITGAIPATYPLLSSVEKVTNGGMETGNPPTGWDVWSNCTIAQVGGGQSGNCLEITRVGGASQYANSVISTIPGKRYKLSGWYKSGTSGNEYSLVGIYTTSWLANTSRLTSALWQYCEDIFVADDVTANVMLGKQSDTPGTMLFDTISVQEVVGHEGLGWGFDGVDDRVVHSAINLGTTHTLHYWIQHQGTSGVVHGGAANYHGLRINDGSGIVGYNAGATEVTVSHNGWLTTRGKTLFSVVRNGTTVGFFQNGIQIGVDQTLDANNDLTLTDFGRYSNGTSYFKGVIFESINKNINKSAQEIKSYYENSRHILGV